MKADFWHQKWNHGEIPFHEIQANPTLVTHIDKLALTENARVFLPLCGKTLDIAWLLERGHQVVGAELSELAVTELFEALKIEPMITPEGNLTHYHADRIDIWVGDIFELTQQQLGPVDAIYDRGALVALPQEMRTQYSALLIAITQCAPHLLITYEYDQHLYQGPPFSLREVELKRHYGRDYRMTLLERTDVKDGFKDRVPATAVCWLFETKTKD